MEEQIINFVKSNLFDDVEVKKGYAPRTCRVVFTGFISGLSLNRLISFCQANNYFFYVGIFDSSYKLVFVIYKL